MTEPSPDPPDAGVPTELPGGVGNIPDFVGDVFADVLEVVSGVASPVIEALVVMI